MEMKMLAIPKKRAAKVTMVGATRASLGESL